MARVRRQIPDQQVRDAADQFDDARLLLHRGGGAGILLPLMNNAAVALELYLKSLCAVTVHTPVADFPFPGLSTVTAEVKGKIHPLIDLLESIPSDVCQALEQAYSTAHGGSALRDALSQYEGLFQASRYSFEKDQKVDKYPLMPLMDLCSFLRGFAARMEPTVRISTQNHQEAEEIITTGGPTR